jgi:hypothetical protein
LNYVKQGLVLSTKIIISEKFSEKVRKFCTYNFVRKFRKMLSFGLATLLEVYKCFL